MKKNIRYIFIAVVLFVISLFVIFNEKSSPPQSQNTSSPLVEISIENGKTRITEKNIAAVTVFEALVEETQKQHLQLKTKSYDFGIFVEQIGEYPNTAQKAWVYYVNGKPGTVAADKQNLTSGDTVEWKYEKPMY